MTAGIEIAKTAGSTFFKQNRNAYTSLGFEEQDLISHLYEEVLCKRYLPTVETKPETYATIANFRSSIFVACKNRLLVHHQAQVTSQKRGGILRAGVIMLDATESPSNSCTYQEMELSVDSSRSYLSRMKELIDQCTDRDVWRALTLLVYGKANSKTDLAKIFSYPKLKFDQLWEALMEYVCTGFERRGEKMPSLVFASV